MSNPEGLPVSANRLGWRTLRRVLGMGALALATQFGYGDVRLAAETSLQHAETQPFTSNQLQVMTANMHGWEGMDDTNNIDDLRKVLKKTRPHLICLQEVKADGAELQSLYADGYNVLFATTYRDPFTGRREGNAVASPFELEMLKAIELQPETSTQRGAILFGLNTTTFRLVGANSHLDVDRNASLLQADFLARKIEDQAQLGCGDYNLDGISVQHGRLGAHFAATWFEGSLFTFPALKPSSDIDQILSTCRLRGADPIVLDINSDHNALLETVMLDESCLS